MKGYPIILTSQDGKKSAGEVTLVRYNKQTRLSRAFSVLGVCWLLSVCSVFFPIVHFVLVPGFFLAGIVAFFMTYPVTSHITKGEGLCPACEAYYEIGKLLEVWPLKATCSFCHANFEIILKE